MTELVTMVCRKDQRWSFGNFVKDQPVQVDLDTAKTMFEAGYADPQDGEEALYGKPEKKQIKKPSKENKQIDPVEEDKSEAEEPDEAEPTEETPEDPAEEVVEEPVEEPKGKGKSKKKK